MRISVGQIRNISGPPSMSFAKQTSPHPKLKAARSESEKTELSRALFCIPKALVVKSMANKNPTKYRDMCSLMLCDGDALVQIDILNRVQKLDAFFARFLKCFTSRDKPCSTCTFIDDGG